MKTYRLFNVKLYTEETGNNHITFLAAIKDDKTEDELLSGITKKFWTGKSPSILMSEIETEGKSRKDLIVEAESFDKIFLFDYDEKRWILRTFFDDTYEILNYGCTGEKHTIFYIGKSRKADHNHINTVLNAVDNVEYMYYSLEDPKTGYIDMKSVMEAIHSNKNCENHIYYFIFPSDFSISELSIAADTIYCESTKNDKNLAFSIYMMSGDNPTDALYKVDWNCNEIRLRMVSYDDK